MTQTIPSAAALTVGESVHLMNSLPTAASLEHSAGGSKVPAGAGTQPVAPNSIVAIGEGRPRMSPNQLVSRWTQQATEAMQSRPSAAQNVPRLNTSTRGSVLGALPYFFPANASYHNLPGMPPLITSAHPAWPRQVDLVLRALDQNPTFLSNLTGEQMEFGRTLFAAALGGLQLPSNMPGHVDPALLPQVLALIDEQARAYRPAAPSTSVSATSTVMRPERSSGWPDVDEAPRTAAAAPSLASRIQRTPEGSTVLRLQTDDVYRKRDFIDQLTELKMTHPSLQVDATGVDFGGMDLTGAPLSGAVLSGANLAGARLRGADLRNAQLVGANLDGANLDGADLRGANLLQASVQNAHMDGVRGDGSQLLGAYTRGTQARWVNDAYPTPADPQATVGEPLQPLAPIKRPQLNEGRPTPASQPGSIGKPMGPIEPPQLSAYEKTLVELESTQNFAGMSTADALQSYPKAQLERYKQGQKLVGAVADEVIERYLHTPLERYVLNPTSEGAMALYERFLQTPAGQLSVQGLWKASDGVQRVAGQGTPVGNALSFFNDAVLKNEKLWQPVDKAAAYGRRVGMQAAMASLIAVNNAYRSGTLEVGRFNTSGDLSPKQLDIVRAVNVPKNVDLTYFRAPLDTQVIVDGERFNIRTKALIVVGQGTGVVLPPALRPGQPGAQPWVGAEKLPGSQGRRFHLASSSLAAGKWGVVGFNLGSDNFSSSARVDLQAMRGLLNIFAFQHRPTPEPGMPKTIGRTMVLADVLSSFNTMTFNAGPLAVVVGRNREPQNLRMSAWQGRDTFRFSGDGEKSSIQPAFPLTGATTFNPEADDWRLLMKVLTGETPQRASNIETGSDRP
jgi:hypothetical protein